MKYYLVVANPIDLGFDGKNTRLCIQPHIELNVEYLAAEYPGQPIVVMKPIATYQTKVDVKLTKFNINDKMEIVPA